MNKTMTEKHPMRFIVSGGGTGGHIFPAISIANALKEAVPEAEILFVGAENRMEMQRVPAAGYPIVGLPVSGFDRKHVLKNVKTLCNLIKSMRKARKVVRDYQPSVVIGVGGYASGPTLRAAASLGIPTLIQEQNSYAGVTNKLLAAKAKRICVAYKGMERFFPAEKIMITGNPVRQDLLASGQMKEEARQHYQLNPEGPVLLVVGGSLGAGTINKALEASLETLRAASDVQVIWQTGRYYYPGIMECIGQKIPANVHVMEFIDRMDYAYAVADLVISRAGASTISELCLLGKAAVLVPSPNVAEDHQTKNALALVQEDAAVMLSDAETPAKLVPSALELLAQPERLAQLRNNVLKLAQHDSAARIAAEVLKLTK